MPPNIFVEKIIRVVEILNVDFIVPILSNHPVGRQ